MIITALLKIKSSKYTAMITILASLAVMAQFVSDSSNKKINDDKSDSVYTAQGIVMQIDLIASTFWLQTNKQSISLYADSATKINPDINFSDIEVNDPIQVTFILMDDEYIARSITCVNRQVSPQKPVTNIQPEKNTIRHGNSDKAGSEYKDYE